MKSSLTVVCLLLPTSTTTTTENEGDVREVVKQENETENDDGVLAKE